MKAKEIYMYILGAIIVIGFFAVLIYKLYKDKDANLEIGGLITGFSLVLGYFFGSSKGSADKNEMLHNSTPITRNPQPE